MNPNHKMTGKKPTKITRGGQPVYVRRRVQVKDGKDYVTWELFWQENGKRRSTSRATKEKAHQLADEIATRLAQGQIHQRILTGIELHEYEEALKLCAEAECSILDAARQVKANKRPIPKCTIAEVREEFLTSKAKRSKRHRQSLQDDTKLLSEEYGDRLMIDLKASDLSKWLNSMNVAGRTKKNRWANIRTMFRWACNIGYLPDGKTEVDRVDHAIFADEQREEWGKDEGFEDFSLLTPEQLRVIFDALPEKLIPILAMGAFAGVRRSEIARIHWRMVREKEIVIPRIVAKKKKKRRMAPYLPVCSAWLEPCRYIGLIVPRADRFNQMIAIAKNLGINWPHNALRHSFISYRLAITKNAAQVAEEAGTSVDKIRSNYDEVASKADAERWFSIFPSTHTSTIN